MTEEPTQPLIRVMALHALAYCERLFYLEEGGFIERLYRERTRRRE